MRKKDVMNLVETKAAEIASKNGVDLFDVDIVKKGGSQIVSVRLTSSKGIDHDVCYAVHQELDIYLDEVDPFEESYFLEVSSPGLDAKLGSTHTLKLSIGKEVQFKTYVAGETWPKTAIGILKDVTDDFIIVENEDESYKVDRTKISSVRLHFSF
jgi:ribosome maturation factor RimP